MVMSTKTIAWFLGSLLFVTWLFQIVGLHVSGGISSEAMVPWLVATMFIPSLWSILYLAVFNRQGWKAIQFRPGNPFYLVVAALIPFMIALGVLALMVQQGWAVSSYFRFSGAGANVLNGPWLMGDGAQGWGFFLANIAATGIFFAFINSAVTLGEEFAWRGVIQHQLIERLGFFKGVALLGFVWGIWHAPVNLAGYNHPDAPILGAVVLFPIELMAWSFIMACLTLTARSFWPAVVMHGSINGISQGLMSSLLVNDGASSITAKLIQIGLIVAVAILCVILMPKRFRGAQNTKDKG
jgi:uncharacterized protein